MSAVLTFRYRKTSGKQALNDSAEMAQLCIRIMNDECKDKEPNKEKVLDHLKNKLNKVYSSGEETDQNYQKECDEIISHGIFSEIVISRLLKNGMSKEDIIKVMKYGLESLELKHLNYFNTLNVTEETLKCSNTSLNNSNKELTEKLRTTGFSDEEISEVVLKGLVYMSECHHFRLTSHGIFAAKILNWQGPVTPASDSIVEFLEQLGLDDDTLKIVSEKGISAEATEIIKGLGYGKYNQSANSENIELIPVCNCMEKIITKKLDSNLVQSSSNSGTSEGSKRSQECNERKNFVRDNLMAPLTWAMSETLKYNPTDPVHYLACQLLRWKHNNVDPTEMKKVVEFLNNTAIDNEHL